MADINLWSILGYALIILGLAGAVVPIMPGPILIWLGALAWAWGNDFQDIGIFLIVVLGILAVVAWGADLILNLAFNRKTGASWKSFIGAVIGGLAGGVLFSGVLPIIGTLLGAFAGALAGTWLAEWYVKRDAAAATRAARGYVGSFILSSILEVTLALIMVALIAWRVFL